jgi:hypothetical protein
MLRRRTWGHTLFAATVLAAAALLPARPAGAATTPGAPTQVLAVASNGTAQVSWNAPPPNGGAVPTSYTVTATGGPYTPPAPVAASPILVTGLQNGAQYTFQVVATNTAGSGPAGASNRVAPGPSDATHALVQVDTGYQALQGVSPLLLGAGLGWNSADNTADPSTTGAPSYQRETQLMQGAGLRLARFPSGAEANCYDWSIGVGANRAHENAFDFPNPAAPNDPNVGKCFTCYYCGTAFGTDEFVAQAQQLGAQPLITVNVCSKKPTPANPLKNVLACGNTVGSNVGTTLCPDPTSPDVSVGCPGAIDAANWVQYLNGDTSTTYGSMRAGNGHSAPYGVRYFEIGNEVIPPPPPPNKCTYLCGPSAAMYAQIVATYATQMKMADSTIRIVAQIDCMCSGSPGTANDDTILNAAGGSIDYLSPHLYPDNTSSDPGAQVDTYLDQLQLAIATDKFAGKIGILPTEWNPSDSVNKANGEVFESMQSAIDAEKMLQSYIRHGVAGSTFFSTNSPGNSLFHCNSSVPEDSGGQCKDQTLVPFFNIKGHWFNFLANDAAGLHSSSDPYWAPFVQPTDGLIALTTVSSTSAHVRLINPGSTPLTAQISLAGVSPTGIAAWQTLSGPPGAVDYYCTGTYNGSTPCSPLESPSVLPVTNPMTAAPVVTVTVPATSLGLLSVPLTATGLTGVHGVMSRAPNSNGWYRQSVGVAFVASQGIGSCTTATYGGPDALGVVVNGSCTDSNGNVVTGSAPPFDYDAQPPTTTEDAFTTGAATLTGGATDNLSGVAQTTVTFTPKLPGTAVVRVATCTSGCGTNSARWSVSTAGLTGAYTATAASVDVAGNTGPPSAPETVIV